MKIIFDIDELNHIPEVSCYNYNFYELPVIIDRCDTLREIFSESYEAFSFSIGRLDLNGEFISVHEFDEDYEGACLEIKPVKR